MIGCPKDSFFLYSMQDLFGTKVVSCKKITFHVKKSCIKWYGQIKNAYLCAYINKTIN